MVGVISGYHDYFGFGLYRILLGFVQGCSWVASPLEVKAEVNGVFVIIFYVCANSTDSEKLAVRNAVFANSRGVQICITDS